jgi:PAS domain S-box-containing protein
MNQYRLSDLLDLGIIQKMADAHYRAAGMPIGIVDAIDGSILVGSGWQDICVKYHRANPETRERCRQSDNYIKQRLVEGEACHYKCQNGLWDIGIPIVVGGRHLATLFLGQFFYDGEVPDRAFFERQARQFGFDRQDYLAALDQVPVFSRDKVDYILDYDKALVGFIADLADHALSKIESHRVIRESEQTFHVIFDHAYQFLGLLSPDGTVLKANRTALEFSGVQEADVLGRPFWEAPWWAHSAQQQQQVRAAVQQAAAGKFVRFEATHAAADGRLHTIDFSLKPVKDYVGKVVLLIPDGRDITERKRTETALAESETKLRSILDNIGIGVALIGPGMEILEMNRRMREWFPGIDSDRRSICYRVFNDPPRDQVCENCPTCLTLQDGLVHEGTTHKPQAGSNRIFRIVTSPLFNAAGDITAAIEIVEDITEKLSLESQFRQAQKMEAIGRLAGGVAHDFNNMLGVILGYAELALDKVDPEQPMHAYLKEIGNAARSSTQIIRQLLAFARKQTIAPKTLDLNKTVEGILKMLRRLIGEDIDLVWRSDSGLWPVKMDPTQIEQALANLCVNARDAITGVGKVTIETGNCTFDEAYCADHAGFVPGEYAMLAISDDGCGIDAAIRDKIFEPFFTTKGVGQGTGLGLATVYGIVKQNNGFINVYSEHGKGTSFKIYLPRDATRHASAAEAKMAELPQSRGETVLVVEDESAVLDLACRMLNELGYTVLCASSSEEALRLAGEYKARIDLLMTDVILPKMNGRDLAQKIKASRPAIKDLFMSGYTANVIAHRGILDQGVHFIPKPFSMQEIAVNVRKALDQLE